MPTGRQSPRQTRRRIADTQTDEEVLTRLQEFQLENLLASAPQISTRKRKKSGMPSHQMLMYEQLKEDVKKLDALIKQETKIEPQITELRQKISKCNYTKNDMVIAFFNIMNNNNADVSDKLNDCIKHIEKLVELYQTKDDILQTGNEINTRIIKLAKELSPHISIRARNNNRRRPRQE